MAVSKEIQTNLRESLGRNLERAVWSPNAESLFPIAVNDVDLKAVIPALLYILRFGARPGKGFFTTSFVKKGDSSGRTDKVTANDIADLLISRENRKYFSYSVEDKVAHRVISNALAGLVFQNTRNKRGTDHAIIRTVPNHFMSAKFDLPERVSNLRGIPEITVSAIVGGNRKTNKQFAKDSFQMMSSKESFNNYVTSLLLTKFAQAIEVDESRSSANTGNPREEINEELAVELEIDQLLQVRVAQCLKAFPIKQMSSGKTFEPFSVVTERQWRIFSEDLRHFIRYYSEDLSRSEFTAAIEMIIGVNIFAMLNSYIKIMNYWAKKGEVLDYDDQMPYQVFIDCSGGDNRAIRVLAENSWDNLSRKIASATTAIKGFQFIEHLVGEMGGSSKLRRDEVNFKEKSPREKLEAAGEILTNENHKVNTYIEMRLIQFLESISNETRAEPLGNLFQMESYLALGAGRVVADLMGTNLTVQKTIGLMKDLLHEGEGPAAAMVIWRQTRNKVGGNSKSKVTREIVASDIFLETFVHRLLIDPQSGDPRNLTLRLFIDEIGSRYGLFVDEEPSASSHLLAENRSYLEERLRALGLLVGVNDSENMKILRPRFPLRDALESDE